MGRRAAKATHLGLSLLGAVLYLLFVVPRWWVLTGDFPATLGTVGRIAAGFPIAAAAVPVMLTLQQALKSEAKTPELALRLRAWSAVLHVVAGALMIITAVVEIWLKLDVAGPWLFAVYGAAGSIAVLAVAAFYLSFVAEAPPAPPKPPKPAKPARAKTDAPPKEKKTRRLGRKRTPAPAGEETETPDAETDEDDGAEPAGPEAGDPAAGEVPPDAAAEGDEATGPEQPASDPDQPSEAAGGGLRNLRPAGRRRHRLRG